MSKVVKLVGGPEADTHRGVPEGHNSLRVVAEHDGVPHFGMYEGHGEGSLLWKFRGWCVDHNEVHRLKKGAREGIEARDRGIKKVSDNDPTFGERIQLLVAFIDPGEEVTSDHIRGMCEEHGLAPKHPNGWGSAIMGCVRSGLLEDTGRVVRSSRKAAHARRLPVYTRV